LKEVCQERSFDKGVGKVDPFREGNSGRWPECTDHDEAKLQTCAGDGIDRSRLDGLQVALLVDHKGFSETP